MSETENKLPEIGACFEFDYVYNERGKVSELIVVVDVTKEHVMYKLPGVSVNKIFPITHEYWFLNQDERRPCQQ